MKKIVLTYLALLLVGCKEPTPLTKITTDTTKEPDEFPIVNNREFICLFEKKSPQERIKCLNKPSSIKVIGYYALAETKGGNNKEQIIHLNGEKTLYILVNTWNVVKPIKLSISSKTMSTHDKNNQILQIDVDKIINNRIEIFDNNNKTIKVIKIIN